YASGITSPYGGSVVQVPPLGLAVAAVVDAFSPDWRDAAAVAAFIALDLCVAASLWAMCRDVMRQEDGAAPERRLEALMLAKWRPKLPNVFHATWDYGRPLAVATVYLLNPAIILQCAAMSLDVVERLFVFGGLLAACQGKPGCAAVALAAAACCGNACGFALLAPAALLLQQRSSPSSFAGVSFPWRTFAPLLLRFAAFAASIAWACGRFLGVPSTPSLWGNAFHARFLAYDELTPNAGLYWYFFAEVFARFRATFLAVFLAHPAVYIVPLVLRLGMFPAALAHILIAIDGVFRPHPTVANPGVAACLFLMHPRSLA
ncbi:unnamed protein product, partial [Phaeothamnion confervicola]